ncbi:MAG: tryptophan--tRNA ligase, partial [Hyphomicrobiaceae bacterium]
ENLVGIYAALAGETTTDTLKQFGGGQFSEFKSALADLTVEKIAPVGGEMRRLMNDPAEIDRVLNDGSERARTIADAHMAHIKDIVGFVN